MNKFILSIIITWTAAYVIKILFILIKQGRLNKEMLVMNGGMPSGHTALAASLTMALLLETGFSPYFLIGVVITILVIYDAVNVRPLIEQQSRVINKLTEERDDLPKLEEKVGHTLGEVMVSLGLSVAIPLIVYTFF
ncbi:MAG: divergent PAP2 family protein [Candidatus Aminicenantes bacterium]|nr:divergent PAP2 family protein [Candidatus Aminicenantes bacterium]